MIMPLGFNDNQDNVSPFKEAPVNAVQSSRGKELFKPNIPKELCVEHLQVHC